MTNLCILTGSRAGSNIITKPRARLDGRRVDRRVDARLTTKSISKHPADIRNESSVPELSLDHAARAPCYTWRSGPFFGLDNSRVTDLLVTHISEGPSASASDTRSVRLAVRRARRLGSSAR